MTASDLPELTDAEWEAEKEAAFADFKASHLQNGNLLIDAGTDTGIREELHYDEVEQKVVLKRIEDVEPTLDWCKARFNETAPALSNEFRHVGRYPVSVLTLFAKKWGFRDWQSCLREKEMVKRLISDSDLAYFRTLSGHY